MGKTAVVEFELSEQAQRRNSLVFILNTSIGYFVAPVFYVGVLHSAILKSQGFSDTIANLPESVFLWMLPFPVLIAWLYPSTRYLKPMLVINYVMLGSAGVAAAAIFLLAPPKWLVYGMTAHAAVVGIANGITTIGLWGIIGQGMTVKRRGWTLGITYGVGPILAVLGSCASQLILSGKFPGFEKIEPLPTPWCYVALFGVTGPAMALCAAVVFLAQRPPDRNEAPAVSTASVIQGLREYFTYRVILIATIGFLLTSAGGNMILNNLGLAVSEAMGKLPTDDVGNQNALRFGCKSLFGFALGWMLARFQAKTPVMATTLVCLLGIIWALAVPGPLSILSFGLMGAGELYYVYYVNYIVGASAPERIRENTAYTSVIYATVGIMPLVYGEISGKYGLPASLYLALAILVATLILMGALLPQRPIPRNLAHDAFLPDPDPARSKT